MNSKKFSRRNFIKGLGAAGVLSQMNAGKVFAQTSSPVRVLMVVLQHGWGISSRSNRSMSGSATDFTFPDGLDPFNAIAQHCNVIDGVSTLGEWGNNHDLSYADILTAGVPHGEQTSSFQSVMPLSSTPSLDFLLQEASGKTSYRFSASYRSWGVSYHPISFDRSSNVLPFYTSAYDAYQSLIADLPDDPGGEISPEEQREIDLNTRIFNILRNPAERQLSGLTQTEQDKLNSYIGAVDQLELANQSDTGYNGSVRMNPSLIPTSGQSSLTDVDSYLEMVKVGFANDLTTSAVLGIGDIHDIFDFHHTHAHIDSDTWWDTRRDFATSVANFAAELDTITDFDGNSLLDNTIILLTGEVGDGIHDINYKGNIVIGGGAHMTTGRWIQPASVSRDLLFREDINGTLQEQLRFARDASGRSNADVLREIGNLAGLNLTQFGLPSQNRGSVLV